MTGNSPNHPHEPPADAEYPTTLRLTSQPFADATADTLDRLDRWAEGEAVPHVVNFQDPSRLQRVLTSRRLELIRSLMDESAESIRDLADRLDRDIRQVHDDIQLLSEYRIVHLEESGGAKQPFVPYETIQIDIELSVASEQDTDSSITA